MTWFFTKGLRSLRCKAGSPPDRALRLCCRLVKLSCFHWPWASCDQTLIMVSRDFSKYQNTHSRAPGKPVHFLLFVVNALACRAPGTWLQQSPEGFLWAASTLTLSLPQAREGSKDLLVNRSLAAAAPSLKSSLPVSALGRCGGRGAVAARSGHGPVAAAPVSRQGPRFSEDDSALECSAGSRGLVSVGGDSWDRAAVRKGLRFQGHTGPPSEPDTDQCHWQQYCSSSHGDQ